MAYSDEVLADSPLAYYRLGEASGTTMVDSSGNGRNGTYHETPTYGTAGLVVGDADTAITFNNDYAQVAYDTWVQAGSFTVEALIQPSALGTRVLAARSATATGSYFNFLFESGVLRLYVWTSSSAASFVSASTSFATGQTYHVAATYDGATAKIYVDGAEVGSASISSSHTATTPLRIGHADNGAGWYFSGVIDEVAYYGTALPATRIAAHYAAAQGATAVDLAAALTGSGSLAANLALVRTLAAAIFGDAALAADLSILGQAEQLAAALAADSALTADLTARRQVQAILAGNSALSAALTIQGRVLLEAALAGDSAFTAALTRIPVERAVTDTFNRTNGRTRSGTGWANLDEPVATIPATLTREPIRVMAQTLPAPTLEKGRPV